MLRKTGINHGRYGQHGRKKRNFQPKVRVFRVALSKRTVLFSGQLVVSSIILRKLIY
jgi:hypothetical protein